MHMLPIKDVYMQNFMFVGVSVIEILEFNQKKKNNNYYGKTVKVLHQVLLIFSQYH